MTYTVGVIQNMKNHQWYWQISDANGSLVKQGFFSFPTARGAIKKGNKVLAKKYNQGANA